MAVALLGLAAPAAAGDVVELKTGRRIQGTFKGADDAAVRIEVNGKIVMLKPAQVKAIYYGATPEASMSQQAAGEEALRVLTALRAMTADRPTYGQYVGRLGYARFRANLLLPKVTDSALASAVSTSLRFFAAARDIWAAVDMVQADPFPARARVEDLRAVVLKAQDGCAALQRIQSANVNEVLAAAVPAAWSCASDKIGDVEQLLGEKQH
jgi:hypothetical protein